MKAKKISNTPSLRLRVCPQWIQQRKFSSNEKVKKIVVVGGSGNFGKRICEILATRGGPNVEILVCGRNIKACEDVAFRLSQLPQKTSLKITPMSVDFNSPMFSTILQQNRANVVVMALQIENEDVVKSIIKNKIHYIDLNIGEHALEAVTKVDSLAKENQVAAVRPAAF
jgi:saccharopine dehydrogenase-like NADP-dependent oxidoreductase